METLERNCQEFGVTLFGIGHPSQGIVHVIGPELGLTQPGKTIVCGDSHTSTHGAFGAIAFGIGTTEVGHVLATQTLLQKRPQTMRITFTGSLPQGCTSKDMILAEAFSWRFSYAAMAALMLLASWPINSGAKC